MTLKLNGSSGGSVSIDAPANTNPSGSDVTLTLPVNDGDANQVLQTDGSGALSWTGANNTPMFLAYPAVTATGISSGVETKVSFTEVHDPQSTYADNSKFTPGVAGYYFFSTNVFMEDPSGSDAYQFALTLYKNGSTARGSVGRFHSDNSDGDHLQPTFNGVIYLDADDYIEVYAYMSTNGAADWKIDGTYGGQFTAFKLIGV